MGWMVAGAWLLALGLGVGAAVAFGARRWSRGTATLLARLEAGGPPAPPLRYDQRELVGLPAPVQRYFQAVLPPGQPMAAGVRIEHTGAFNLGEAGSRWAPFTSRQVVVAPRPGFLWDARIRLFPGLAVFVHDAYVAGEGRIHASLLGLATVARMGGTPALAEGELMRYLAEAVWYPTALLPSQGVCWEARDETSARATLEAQGTRVFLDFHFDAAGLVERVRAAARFRTAAGRAVPTPWQVRVWGYAVRGGLRIPLEGEAAWELPGGLRPYWRGRITSIAHAPAVWGAAAAGG